MAQIKNSIFNKKKLKYQIEKVNFNDISDFQNKLELVNKWVDFVSSASFYKSKETELQGNFLFDVFGKVLGYTSKLNNPIEWNLNQEQVTTGGKFADGSLGFYSSGNEIIRVVIELKDANSNLDEKQHRHHDNRTPVEQAFDYKHRIGKDCKWIIVSNFNEIRLYHHSSYLEYEQFFIKDLGEEEKLKRFFFLLGKDNLIAKDGNSAIDSLFISNEQDEQEITKKFYAAFKDIRLKFFDHLKTNNPTIDENILLEKTQKLLDRFIFICFAEDNRLLPETIFKNMIKTAKHSFSYSETKVWTELKGLFNAINIGSPPHNINKFNGGLFAADEVLDSLQIKDQILEDLSSITDYDFESDVSIDILGHIFEQSISDLEEIKASINGEVFEKSKSKRKRDGIVYTPAYITRDIVEKAVGGWLEDRKIELGYYDLPELTDEDYKSIINNRGKINYNDKIKLHLEFWYAYRERLMNIKVLDPACGSGAFLIQVFDYLYAEGNKVNDTIAKLLGGQYEVFQLDKHILSNNIYGVDINSESVEITKLSLWLKTANKNAELTSLDNNIKCGNSLIDDPEVAGDKAFDWEKEYAEILLNGGFDVVVGNPPYGAELTNSIKEYFKAKYDDVHYRTIDTFNYFISQSFRLTKNNGYISLIVPNNLLFQFEYFKTRLFLIQSFKLEIVINFGDGVFQSADVPTCLFLAVKTHKENYSIKYKDIRDELNKNNLVDNFQLLTSSNIINLPANIIGVSDNSFNLIEKVKNKSVKIDDIAEEVASGISTGGDKIFRISSHFATSNNFEHELLRNVLVGGEINRYSIINSNHLLIYTDRSCKIHDYTNINNYLLDYKEKLLSRSESKAGTLPWYSLGRQRYEKLFIEDKIILRQTSDDIKATVDFEGYFTLNSIIILKINKNKMFDYKFIITILNSKLNNYIYKLFSQEEGRAFAEVKPNNVRKLFIPNIDLESQQPFITLADTMLDKNKELQEKNSKFQELLKADFNIEKLNTKLENWYNLSWTDFVNELKKLKITLSGERKEDWIERFSRYKSQATELQNIIQTTDRKIDQLVYQLYELTEEEIKVVEGE